MSEQDRGSRIEDRETPSPEGREGFSPQSSVLRSKQQAQSVTMFSGADPCGLNPDLLQRVRWRCRRGLLELDIIFARFIEVHYASLTEQERQIFEELLDMPDNPLWDLVSGKQAADSEAHLVLLAKIKSV